MSPLPRSTGWSDVIMATKTLISYVKENMCHNFEDQLVNNIVSRKCSDVKWLLKLIYMKNEIF
jgi:hypothetical protein